MCYNITANPSSGLPVFDLSPSNVPGSTGGNVYLKGTTIVLICRSEVGKCRRYIDGSHQLNLRHHFAPFPQAEIPRSVGKAREIAIGGRNHS